MSDIKAPTAAASEPEFIAIPRSALPELREVGYWLNARTCAARHSAAKLGQYTGKAHVYMSDTNEVVDVVDAEVVGGIGWGSISSYVVVMPDAVGAVEKFSRERAAFLDASPSVADEGERRLCWLGTREEHATLQAGLADLGGSTIGQVPSEPDGRPAETFGFGKHFRGSYRNVLLFEAESGGGFTWGWFVTLGAR